MTTSVFIVDDHCLFREGLRSLLERQEGLVVAGEAGDADTAIRLAGELEPDIILMDLHMPGRSGLEAIREIVHRHPNARVIALTMYQDAEMVQSALLAGAQGYLLKDDRVAVLVDGIRAVAAGGVAINPRIGVHLLQEYRRLAAEAGCIPCEDFGLSSRELSVLEHLAAGHSNRQIADKLFLSEQTVKNLLTTVYHKLGVQNRTEAVLRVVQRGSGRPGA